MTPDNASPAAGSSTESTSVKWTVMVFMGADTIGHNAPLIDAAKADLEEMAYVGSGNGLNIFVQVHGMKEVPQRTQIIRGPITFSDVPEDERVLDDGHAIERFISWALPAAKHDPRNPNHYSMLVLWGHAYDFAFGRERRQDDTVDALDFAELMDVLRRLQKRFGAGAKLDILGFDACDLATVEMSCQLEPFAKYLLGSQIGIPIPGWPYDRVLWRLRHPFGSVMGPPEFGAYVVRRFCESYRAEQRPVSLTLLDLQKATDLSNRAEVLALMLARVIKTTDMRDWIAYLFTRSQTAEGRPYVDVADLCLTLMRESGDTLLAEAARDLGDFLISPQPPLVGESDTGGGQPFIVEHGRNAGHTARLNGVSLYAPHVAPSRDFEAARPMYQNFIFAQQTVWSEIVHTLARLT
jgi:Clostripain family